MVYYLIVCRSLTHAQRTASVLERVGIAAHVIRAPRGMDSGGCSHAVKIAEHRLGNALMVLRRAELSSSRIFMVSADGGYKEVRL